MGQVLLNKVEVQTEKSLNVQPVEYINKKINYDSDFKNEWRKKHKEIYQKYHKKWDLRLWGIWADKHRQAIDKRDVGTNDAQRQAQNKKLWKKL